MSKFAVENVYSIKAKEVVDQLTIDDEKVLEIFENELNGTTYKTELNSILLFVEHIANGGSVGRKCKILKGNKDGVMEYEFISKHLRLYAIQQTGKKIIIFGGTKKKADSSDNIALFRNLKKDFLNSLKK